MSTDKTIRIVQALREAFPNFSRTQAEKLIRSGKVLVNGKLARFGSRVADNAKISLVDTATKLMPNAKLSCRLLRQTKDFLFLEKPSGMHSIALDFDETNSVANWLISVDVAQAELDPLEAGLVHRLDFETSGVMVAAKNATAKKILEKSFREHRIRKEYTCLVDKPLKPGLYRAYAGKNPKSDKKIHIQERASQKLTSLRTEILSITKASAGFLVRVNLITGYRHQIRAHLALLGSPIRGDKLYGGAKAERLYLHAQILEFNNSRGQKLLVQSEYCF
jgi:23S rRNA pseudouridine1911/1915/1917 synthase